jgi:hypothetical protein
MPTCRWLIRAGAGPTATDRERGERKPAIHFTSPRASRVQRRGARVQKGLRSRSLRPGRSSPRDSVASSTKKALTVTDNNNGFVSIFFLLIPAFTCLLSLWMSRWISELKFTVGPLFFLGLGLIAAPILVFLGQSQKGSSDRSAIQEMDMKPSMCVSDPV